jgi:hypothetical protein
MELGEIKKIAAGLGIELPGRTRGTTYIDHILGEVKGEAPAVEVADADVEVEHKVTAEGSSNGQVYDADDDIGPIDLAEVVRTVLIKTLDTVLTALKSEG